MICYIGHDEVSVTKLTSSAYSKIHKCVKNMIEQLTDGRQI